MRTDGEPDGQLEGEPRVADALDVEERQRRVGGALVQQPRSGVTAVRIGAGHRDVDDDRNAQVRVCFQAEDTDGDENEEDGQCRYHLYKHKEPAGLMRVL